MTLGQMSEIVVLALMPILTVTFNRKSLLAIGLVAYALRFYLFQSVGTVEGSASEMQLAMVVGGILLHGLCFGCFIFVAFMVVDEQMSADIKASGQNLFNLVVIGIGIIVGSLVAGWVAGWAKVDDVMHYDKLFSIPMWGAIGCLAIFLIAYPNKAIPKS